MMGKKIRMLRESNGLTQKQFGERIGVSKGVVSSYETDARQPSYGVLKRICVTFGVSADYLLGIEKESLQIPFHDLTEKQFQIISELISEFTKSNE